MEQATQSSQTPQSSQSSHSPQAAKSKGNFFTRPKTIMWIVIFALFLTLILQNVEPVQIDLLFWSLPNVPLLLLIIISMAVGALLYKIIAWEIGHYRKNRHK